MLNKATDIWHLLTGQATLPASNKCNVPSNAPLDLNEAAALFNADGNDIQQNNISFLWV